MTRKVFYSFHYRNDINRVMIVRNRWVTYGGQVASGLIDSAAFMRLEKKGRSAIESWIDEQLKGTSATIVLIGAETLDRPFVRYEICQSLNRNNTVIGVYVHRLKDFNGNSCAACNKHTPIGTDEYGKVIYFDSIADGIYDYVLDDGYNNLNSWVDKAVNRHRLPR